MISHKTILHDGNGDIISRRRTVRGKNWIPYPYFDTTKTYKGITFTDNGDGSVTANGTATENSTFYFYKPNGTLPTATYTYSGNPAGATVNIALACSYIKPDDTVGYLSFATTSTVTPDKRLNTMYIYISSGTTVNNLVFRPQLELGSTATAYEPYLNLTSREDIYNG